MKFFAHNNTCFPILSPLPPIHQILLARNQTTFLIPIALAFFLLNERAEPPDLKHIKQPLRDRAQERLNWKRKVYGGHSFSGVRASFLPTLHYLLKQTRGGNNGIAGSTDNDKRQAISVSITLAIPFRIGGTDESRITEPERELLDIELTFKDLLLR
jgi:hypothetical protein